MTNKKTCKKCGGSFSLVNFYKCKGMKDGRLNKCKKCTREDVTKNRNKNIQYYREYDRKRGNRQEEGYLKEWRIKYPNKYKAHTMINNALRDGKLFKKPCETCGDVITHGHHDNYLEPLNVRWLCPVHHSQWHKENGEALNP